MPRKNISLQFGCPENLTTLKPAQQGYFSCQHCPHKVQDFRNKTLEEINQFAKHSNKQICGIFGRDQLSQQFLKVAAMSLIIGASGFSVQAQSCPSPNSEFPKPTLDTDTARTIPLTPPPPPIDAVVGIFEPYYRPEPAFGYEEFYKEIGRQVKWPEGLTEDGTLYLKFSIDSTGRVYNLEVIRSFDPTAAVAVINSLSILDFRFIPAKDSDGNPINSKLVLPIRFRLKGKAEED